jgi:hypothetical protein
MALRWAGIGSPVKIGQLKPASSSSSTDPAAHIPIEADRGFRIVTAHSGLGRKSVNFEQNSRSASSRITGHVRSESAVNLVRNTHEGYHWTRVLRREGLWPLQPHGLTEASSAVVASKSVPRFARVRIEPLRAEPAFPLRLQLILANGRQAQLELSDERQLPRVLGLLERPG